MSITIASWSVVKSLQEQNAHYQFDAALAEAVGQVKHYFAGYEQVLKGGVGLMLASDSVTRNEWRIYVESLRLDESYPGIHGVGFSQYIRPAEMAKHIASLRADGFPAYKIWPDIPRAPRDDYTAIVYIEPFNATNRRALGYDMFSNPVRRAAMSRARDSGAAALSGKVKLVQETSEDVQAGILMYIPYYGPGGIPETLDRRRSSLVGYVYAPFRMDDFINAVLRTKLDDLGFKIFDGASTTPDALLFDSGKHRLEHSSFPQYTRTVPVSLYGQIWTIEASSRPGFEQSVSSSESEFILFGGILVSILTAVVVFMLSSNKEKTTALARTNVELASAINEQQAAVKDLSIATLRTQRILESITDAFYTLDREWRFTYLNNEAQRLLRLSSDELLGKNIWKEFPQAIAGPFYREFHRALIENCTVSFEEFYAPLDGWFEVRAYPSVEGLAVYFRDVTERKRAEKMRREADKHIRQQASLLDKANDAIIVRGVDHRIQFWNQGAQRLYGWTSDEVIGRSVEEVIYDDPIPFREAFQQVLRDGEWNGEIVQRHKDGSPLTAEVHWTLVRDDEEGPQRILSINTDISARKMAEKEIHHLAFYDSLTGLPNRQLLLDRLKQALAISGRKHQTGALLFIDLDNFKLLNDTLGHDVGDLLLQQVAPRLISCVRDSDTVARLGGDEFIIILVGGFSPQPEEAVAQIRAICDRIVAAFRKPFTLRGHNHNTTPSIGIAVFNDQSAAMDELLKQADLAMYQAKAAGRNSACLFTPDMQSAINDRVVLESDLHKSWERNEFVLHFQPQVKGRRVVGAEALVRWQHPRRGLISPADFISHAEETGLILPLGSWILDSACAQLAAWAGEPEMAQLDLAVNVSPLQFRQPDFVPQILETLARTGANPRKLKLELTESLLVRNIEDTIAKMTALKAVGVGFALDDFGTGYSSLYYLKRLPLDWVKIDQSFVRELLTNPHDATIVRAIIILAKSMGLKVIAEGVETEAQRNYLARHGCSMYQGFLASPPLPSAQFTELMRKR
ncbi:EAL domain-containing protein [Nitrosospira sp. Is2]|uniref:bifunctional diguanylate cyclase/phosphodiesterase n=1 Tax=Nitrosospira sp. Is2 TaxID=3080532 RepID=UPI002952B23A|nr:EAL domain-containing protein [Nitrosospira sp. Is2]WON73598.1 EAL domain-containing protein [Nitrosospira sp. Is2]